MNKGTEHQLAVPRGSERVRSVWLSPTPSGQNDYEPIALPSAGLWVEKRPNTFGRQQVTVPVIVGSTLRIF